MYITKLRIDSFGGARNFTLEPSRGLNVIEGGNEAGKTALAMFIKFIFYGLSGRESGGGMTERERYTSWTDGVASGAIEFVCEGGDGGAWRIERTLSHSGDGGGWREVVRTIDMSTGTVAARGGCPGERFFGVPEEVFVNTVFVRQAGNVSPGGTAVDGEGAGGAIENLLFSADESADAQKAISKLDAERRKLRHKNGSGGEIAELESTRRALADELEKASGKAQETIALEGTVAELNARIAAAEEKAAQLKETAVKIDATAMLSRFAALRETEAAMREADRRAAALDAPYGDIKPDRAALERLRTDYRTYTEALSAARSAEAELAAVKAASSAASGGGDTKPRDLLAQNELLYADPATLSDDDVREVKRALGEEAASSDAKKRALFSASAVLLVFGVIACVGGFALRSIIETAAVAALIAAALFFSTAIVCLTAAASASRKLAALFDRWGVRGEDTIDEAVDDIVADRRRSSELTRKSESLAATAQEKRAEAQSLAPRIFALALAFTRTTPASSAAPDAEAIRAAVRAAEETAEKYISARETLDRERTALAARRDALAEQTVGLDEAKLEARAGAPDARPDPASAAAVRRELEFTEKSLEAMKIQLRDRELRLASLKGVGKSPAELAQEIDAIDARLAEARARHDALVLAVAAMSEASEKLRSSVAPRLAAAASQSMSILTHGRYTALGVGADLSLTFTSDGYTHAAGHMSAGTADAAYLSLRLALAELLYRRDMPPIVFDEAFARLDDNRLAAAVRLLERRGAQSFLLTCQSREAALAGNVVRI